MNKLDLGQIIDFLLDNVMEQKQKTYSKIYPQNIMDQIEKEQLHLIKLRWKDQSKRMNMIEFVKLLISIIEHKQNEMLYLIMGLIELFKEIIISTNSNQNNLMITDITSYICEKTEQHDFEIKIPEQRVPAPRRFEQNLDRVREIDVEAPQVINTTTVLSHIMPNYIKTDKVKHQNGTVQSGQFIEETNQIITLDSLGTKLNIYNLDCQIESYITLKNKNQKHDEDKEAIIMGFAWSSRQQRIGITLKSHYLCFFDQHDNFKVPRMFSTSSFSQDHQTSIWCLNNYNFWITTDATNKLYQWDIQEQSPKFIFQSPKIKSPIIEVQEVLHLKLMATASLDKQIAFWDIQSGQIKIQINMEEHGGIHSMVYSYSYQIMITCGYSTNIQIFQIHPIYMDVTLVGKLQGHASMLTAIQMLGSSPILCSGDDIGNIRLWNVKNFQCVQCLSFGRRTQIQKILDISIKGIVCFLGSRVNLIKLDDRQTTKKTNENYPMRIEFHSGSEYLVVASRKELMFINIHNGRIKKIYSSLLQDQEDEIVQFMPMNHFNRFLLGDSRGGINLYQCSNGEQLKQMKGHQTEITHLKTDVVNNLIISASWDQFQIQRESIGIGKVDLEVLREVSKFQQGVEITFFEISVHHNLILAASLKKLSIYDYELLRLLGEINADKDSDISFLAFIKLYSIFAIGSNIVKIFSFLVKDQQEIQLDIIAVLDPYYLLNDIAYFPYNQEPSPNTNKSSSSKTPKQSQQFFGLTEVAKVPLGSLTYNPSLVKNEDREGFEIPINCLALQEGNQLELYLATNKGQILVVDITEIIFLYQLQLTIHAYEKLNYNPYRAIKEDYVKQFNKCQYSSFSWQQTPFQTQPYVEKNHQKILFFPKKALLRTVQAQKKAINSLYLLQLDQNYIATSAIDGFINIHDLQGNLVASLNINHPLPILWSLVYGKNEQLRKKIVYALKIMEILQKQASTNEEKQVFSIQNIAQSILTLDSIIEENPSSTNVPVTIPNNTLNKQQSITIRKSSKFFFPNINIKKVQNKDKLQTLPTDPHNKVIIMGDEYSPRDLKYNQIRKLYQSELQGPSIKQMDSYTRSQEAFQQVRLEEIAQKEKEKMFEQKELEKQKVAERGGSMDFLDQYYHDKQKTVHYQAQDNYVRQNLEEKLDTCVRNQKISIYEQSSDNAPLNRKKKTQILGGKKLEKNAKSLMSKDFFDYANDKNLTSQQPTIVSSTLSNNSYISHILVSPRSEFNPTFFMKNIDKVGLINLDNSQKWLGHQKREKSQLNIVLQHLNQKVSQSKNLNVKPLDSIHGRNVSQFSDMLSYSNHTNKIIDILDNDQQNKADKEIDRVVLQIQNKVQQCIKQKLETQI